MSQNPEAENSPAPAHSLDATKLGTILLNLVPVSVLAHHATVHGTCRDYIRAEIKTPELVFLRDLMTLSTAEVADRWFGGELEAASLASNGLAALHG